MANGIYSDDTTGTLVEVVMKEWRSIVGKVMRGAVVTYANAFDGNPTQGEVNVSHARRRPLELPGLTIRPDMVGRRDADDIPFGDGIFLASTARALVDNSADHPGRPSTRVRKLTREQLHDRVVEIVNTTSPDRIDRLLLDVRDRAPKKVSEGITVFVAAARAEIKTVDTASRALRAAQRGEGYDRARVERFVAFAHSLNALAPIARRDVEPTVTSTVPFWESYFSNYIEGTEFTVDEAVGVVYAGIDHGRPEDAHDIAGTFHVVASAEMRVEPSDAEEFLDRLRARHATMMGSRPTSRPGLWKDLPNRAGSSEFVAPDLVPGTLRAGWEEGQQVLDPFGRAVYTQFLVSEVHPFVDGNGRSSRVAMNNVLAAAGVHRVIVPTILRLDYLSALTRATNDGGPEALFAVFNHAQHWVSRGDWSTVESGLAFCRRTNALVEPREAEESRLHLVVPRWSAVPSSPEA
ncbi:MAG: Fic family protein [Propionibacteriaceae bacterium]|nr:Fic family protein [Propionibacteriaceae bacterium]